MRKEKRRICTYNIKVEKILIKAKRVRRSFTIVWNKWVQQDPKLKKTEQKIIIIRTKISSLEYHKTNVENKD